MDENRDIPIYNLWSEKPYITLKPAEEICPECKGNGVSDHKPYGYYICRFCFGTGKVDWIKRIRGKKCKMKSQNLNGEKLIT